MSKMSDYVLQMMDDSGIFEESQNECAAQRQIEHDQQGKVNDGQQNIEVSTSEKAF